VRTRIIVAVAALMAASALVAVPGPAGSSAPIPARTVDAATLMAVSIALPAGSPATSILETDIASRSAGWLGPDSAIAETALAAPAYGRSAVRQPVQKAMAFNKSRWRHDGNISWYGPGFYGRRTACGYAFTQTLIGVAHRTLPCGALVTFRNPANGRQVTAPVVDRGPYVSGRTWDMSAGLCAALGHCYTGSIEWHLGSGSGG